MLSPIQVPTTAVATTALERVAGDKVVPLRVYERWASSPDAMSCYWDELFNAVCERLEHLAQLSADPPLHDGVQECVAALAQLHVSISDERARHRLPAGDAMALRQPRDLL